VVEQLHILTERLDSPDEETRRIALSSIVSYPLAEIKGALFRAMGDESWRVRKEAVDVFLALPAAADCAEELIALLRSHDNAGLRNSAVEALTKLGVAAVPFLQPYASDADHDVRKFVIDIMGSIGDSSAVVTLIHALADPDANVCAAAAENLGKIGDTQAVPHLLQALANPDVWLRYTIMEALGKIGEPVPLPIITQLAEENLLKKAVFDCLGAIGGAEAVPLLLGGLRERQKNAREAAVAALIKVRGRLPTPEAEQLVDGGLRELKGSPFVEGLLAMLDTTDASLKESLVRILGIIGDERSTGALLRGCRDDRLRNHCLQAFKSLDDTGVDALIKVFPSAEEDVRCFITYLCGELGIKKSTPLLREGMGDPFPMLRKASVVAAGKIGLLEFAAEIATLLDDQDSDVRDGAIEALTRFAARDASVVLKIALTLGTAALPEKRRDAALLFGALKDADKLALLIKDESAMVRRVAVSQLAALKMKSSASHLLMALVDEDVDVRIAVAGALGEIGGEEVLAPLLLSLRDDDPWVKCAALKSLGQLGGENSLQAIVSVFDTAEGLVLIAALEAVAKIGGVKSREMLKNALGNADEEVVKAAIEHLSRQGDFWIEEFQARLLNHPSWDVRSGFARVMTELWGKRAIPYLRQALETECDAMVKDQLQGIVDRLQ